MSTPKNSKQNRPRELFFGSLPGEVTEAALKEFYSDYGEVDNINIIKRIKKPACGFLRFGTAESVGKAMAGRPHKIKGKSVNPIRAALGDDPSRTIQVVKLFVGGLRQAMREEEKIQEVFEKFGDIEEIKFKTGDDGKKRNFAVITYADPDSCDKALLRNKHKIDGQEVLVKKFLNKEEQKEVDQRMREKNMRQERSRGQGFGPQMGFPGRVPPFGFNPAFSSGVGKILPGSGGGSYGMGPGAGQGFGMGRQMQAASFGQGRPSFGPGGREPFGMGSGFGQPKPPGMFGEVGQFGGQSGYGAGPFAVGAPRPQEMNNVGFDGLGRGGGGGRGAGQNDPRLQAILLKAKVSEEAIALLAREHLLDTELLRSTSLEELAALGLPFGDRKRIQLLMS